jgi:iron(II)-dependent oxidoreductase
MHTTTEAQPSNPPPASSSLRDALRSLLERVRARTLLILEPLSEEDARVQHDPLMSPIVWDLGHIASFEKLWLQDQVDRAVRFSELPGLYNPFEHPRAERGALELPSLLETLAELARLRELTLQRLERVEFDAASPLLRDGYVYGLVAQHESQHLETILQTLQLKRREPYPAPRAWSVPDAAGSFREYGAMVRFPGGAATIGTNTELFAYDNERPAHDLEVAPFEMDVTPVTCGAFREFIEDGGYDEQRHWSDAGWRWARESGARAPKHWRRSDSGWMERIMNLERALDLHRPVIHVCYHEADAFARWAGKRLPTETEWEVAATWHPQAGRQRFPWGDEPATPLHANVDQLAFDTAPAGAYERNISPLGCHGMIGDVWEWTSTDFAGYQGFRAFPYPEYSEAFFGSEYKVLRGGSWATAENVVRATFRNWDFPIRQQIFSGFRCARDS